MEKETVIIDVQISDIHEQIEKNKLAIESLKKERKELTKAYKDGLMSEEGYLKNISANAKSVYELQKANKKLSAELKKITKEQKAASDEAKEAAAAIDILAINSNLENLSLKEKRQALAAAKKQYAEMKVGVNATREEMNLFATQLKILNEDVKRTEAGYGDMQRYVGDYKQSILEAANNLGIFRKANDQLGGTLGIMATGFKGFTFSANAAAGGVKGFTLVLRVLRTAIAATGIGLLVIALTSLVAWFQKTEKGTIMLRKAMAILQGVFDGVIAVITRLGEAIFEIFSEPKKVIDDFVNFIKTDLYDVVKDAGAIISGVFTGDLDKAGKAVDNFKKRATNAYNSVVSAIKNTINETNGYIQAQLRLEELQRATAKSLREIEMQQARLSNAYQIAIELADDDTRGWRDREKASEKALKLQSQLSDANLQKARLNLKLAEEELKLIELTDGSFEEKEEARKKMIEAQINYENSLAEKVLQRRDAEEKVAKMRRDAFEQELDYAIEYTNTLSALQQEIIDFDNLDIQSKKEALERQTKLLEEGYLRQISLIESYSKQKIDLEKVFSAESEKNVNDYLRTLNLDEKSQQRLLEVYKERQEAVKTLSQNQMKLSELNQEIANRDIEAQNKILEIENKLLEKQVDGFILNAKKIQENEQIIFDNRLQLLRQNLEARLITEQEYAAKVLELETQLSEAREMRAQKEAEMNRAVTQELVSNYMTMFGDITSLFEQMGEDVKAFRIAELTMNYIAELGAIFKYSAENPANSVTFGAAGAALAAIKTTAATARYLTGVSKISGAFAGGGSFITKGKTNITVGDNPGGRELVTVIPLSGRGVTKIYDGNKIKMAGGGVAISEGVRVANSLLDFVKTNQRQQVIAVENVRRVNYNIEAMEKMRAL